MPDWSGAVRTEVLLLHDGPVLQVQDVDGRDRFLAGGAVLHHGNSPRADCSRFGSLRFQSSSLSAVRRAIQEWKALGASAEKLAKLIERSKGRAEQHAVSFDRAFPPGRVECVLESVVCAHRTHARAQQLGHGFAAAAPKTWALVTFGIRSPSPPTRSRRPCSCRLADPVEPPLSQGLECRERGLQLGRHAVVVDLDRRRAAGRAAGGRGGGACWAKATAAAGPR